MRLGEKCGKTSSNAIVYKWGLPNAIENTANREPCMTETETNISEPTPEERLSKESNESGRTE